MKTTIHTKAGVTILEPTGKIIGEAVPELRAALIKQIDTTQTPCILINFEHVHKMNSAGLSRFVTAYNMARPKNGRIGIINVSKHIKNLIVQTRLINLFEHYKNEEAAIAALSNCA